MEKLSLFYAEGAENEKIVDDRILSRKEFVLRWVISLFPFIKGESIMAQFLSSHVFEYKK